MKKVLIITGVLLVCGVLPFLWIRGNTKNNLPLEYKISEAAEEHIKSQLEYRLDDPGSYQPEYTSPAYRIDTLEGTPLFSLHRKGAGKYGDKRYLIEHTYRAKNNFGALTKVEEVFFVDSTGRVRSSEKVEDLTGEEHKWILNVMSSSFGE